MTDEKYNELINRHIKNNLEIYEQNKDVITMYNEYTKRVTEFFDFLMKEKNDLLYTLIFNILINFGFFSADREFNPETPNHKELSIKLGLSIINGSGVCRNIASFYNDVFKNLFNYPLMICCLDRNYEVDEDTKTYGNHIINLTRYHDSIFGFDVLNQCLFIPKAHNKLTSIEFDYSLEYVPIGDLLLELITSLTTNIKYDDEVKFKQALLEVSSMRDVLDIDEYQKLVCDANDFIINRQKIFRGFLVQNEELTHEIKKKMLLLK